MFKKTFSSLTQLGTEARKTLIQAQTNVGYRLLDELLSLIFEEVYLNSLNGRGETSNDFYERTVDLISIWDVVDVTARSRQKGGGSQQAYVSIQPVNDSGLTHDENAFQHSSPNGGDLTAYDFAMIINNGLSDQNSMFGAIRPRPYWDKFLKWANENYQRIFEEECASLGLHLSGVGTMSITRGNQHNGKGEGSTLVKYK